MYRKTSGKHLSFPLSTVIHRVPRMYMRVCHRIQISVPDENVFSKWSEVRQKSHESGIGHSNLHHHVTKAVAASQVWTQYVHGRVSGVTDDLDDRRWPSLDAVEYEETCNGGLLIPNPETVSGFIFQVTARYLQLMRTRSPVGT